MVTRDKTEKQRLAPGRNRGRVEVCDVSIAFGSGTDQFLAIDRISLEIEAGEFRCIVGPSGCGKSTLMNAIAGFENPTEGHIAVDGEVVEGPGADRGMVFQQANLFPWKSVRANVAHGPRMLGKSDTEAMRIADELLEMVGLSAFADSRPQTLSGGMQQRTAIARALANTPSVLLMDEPFGALDAQTRAMMQENLLQIWSDVGSTVVFITHDIDEAIFLADRIEVMSASPGRIVRQLVVDLPRPRDVAITLDPAFAALKRQCLELIRTESLRAFEQQTKAQGRG